MTDAELNAHIRRADQLAARLVQPGTVIRSLGEREQMATTLKALAEFAKRQQEKNG